jgi:thiol:disulfide interchange protein DsbD
MSHLIKFIVVCVWLAATAARAAHTEVQLLLSATNAAPGATIFVGVDLKMEPGWHTYWKNPGAAGQATEIKWELPPGVTAGEIQWPLPQKLPPIEVTTYVYENEVVLLAPLTLATNLAYGPLELKASVSWLECKEVCIPASANVATKLAVARETKPSDDAATIESWLNRVPLGANPFSLQAWWEPATGNKRTLNIGHPSNSADKNFAYDAVDFFPDASSQFEVQPATEAINLFSASLHLRKPVKKYDGDWPKEIAGVLVVEQNNARSSYELKLPVADVAPAGETIGAQTPLSNSGGNPADRASETPVLLTDPLWKMLIYAFIGGLILNIMPCVLPVIALKILGFVSEGGSSPRRVRALGGIYVIGVLISFLVLAAIVIGVKAAGHQAGWGMQFGSPIFIVCLTTLVLLVALNLFGIFEVTLGGRAIGAAAELTPNHGATGAFFNGVLATTLATPCTAPFLAPALGFAFAQNAPVILLFFLTVGLGLAAPYLVLSWNPAWLKFLPKPGAWMEKFKIAMGFPMLATVVWLFNIAASTYEKNVKWLGVFLVMVACAAWIFGEFVQRGRRHKILATVITLALLATGYAFALERQLDWRAPFVEKTAESPLKESAEGIDWQRWSPEAVAEARSGTNIVLVDFTADWCLTCQLNKNSSIEITAVREQIKQLHVVAFMGDYTHFADNITAELNRYNRAGVPLVLVYPKDGHSPPIVLPELLTPSIMLNAISAAAQ